MSARRTNQILERLDEGSVAMGVEVKTQSTEAVELLGDIGLDFVWLDLEHSGSSPYDGSTLEAYQRAADAAGVTLLVRLPDGDPAMVRKVLDTGVRALLIPRVETAADVRAAVRASRFTIDGEPGNRGIGTARGSRWGFDLDDHPRKEDETVLVGAMIENETAVENVKEILDVPGLGFVFVGKADLSVSLGVPLRTDATIVQEHVERVLDASREANVPVGRIATGQDEIEMAVNEGYSVVRVGTDLDGIHKTFDTLLDDVEGTV